MAKYYYPAIFEPAEEGGFVVYLPDFDGSVTEGDNLDEATRMVKSLIFCCLDGVNEKDYPEPSKISELDTSKYISEYKAKNKDAFINIVEYDPNDFKHENVTANFENQIALSF